MDSRTFFKSLLDRENLNPTSLSKRMTSLGYDAVNQSVMSRFLKGSDLSVENARRIGLSLDFDFKALLDDETAESEAIRMGIYQPRSAHQSMSENTSSTVRPYSVTKQNLAPVFAWARLGAVLFIENKELSSGEYLSTLDIDDPLIKWFISDEHMPRLRIKRGARVLIQPTEDASQCEDDETCLFKTASGAFVVGDFRRLSSGYEAIPDSGPPMDSQRHGIKLVGIVRGSIMPTDRGRNGNR